jgi:choline kinase
VTCGGELPRVIGVVLAAGAGRRLRPYTDEVPKALVPLLDGRSVLDVTLENFAVVGLTDVAIVVGYRREAIEERVDDLATATGLRITLVDNDHALDRNNAYSLWCAREHFDDDVLLANGDTLHPAAVDRALIDAPPTDGPLIAIDDVKPLGDEEMKVLLRADGCVGSISKLLPHDADGEYIGVARVLRSSGASLIGALERTWRRDPNLYYEDAFQLLADEGCAVGALPIGEQPWTEIDDVDDLVRAKELMCRY